MFELDARIPKSLVALPVYNEAKYVDGVLAEVSKHASHILVVNDGSTDGTQKRLELRKDIQVVNHPVNRGYGAALKSAFQYAIDHDFEYLVTLDCDGQHQPQRIPRFLAACGSADIVSGSRYLKEYEDDNEPPQQRLFINRHITAELNRMLCLRLTDAFCGFKAYRVDALRKLDIEDNGYAMPLELWVQAAMRGMRIIEVPVPRIYLDANRTFGGALDDAEKRLEHYNQVIRRSVQAMCDRGFQLPSQRAARMSMTTASSSTYPRYRVPRSNGTKLVEPDFAALSVSDKAPAPGTSSFSLEPSDLQPNRMNGPDFCGLFIRTVANDGKSGSDRAVVGPHPAVLGSQAPDDLQGHCAVHVGSSA